MKTEFIQELLVKFEHACYDYNGIECWSARELQFVFNYFAKIQTKIMLVKENKVKNN